MWSQQIPTEYLGTLAYERQERGTHERLGVLYWLSLLLLLAIILVVSGELQYARLAGGELYDELTTGSTGSRQVAFFALGCASFLSLILQPRHESKQIKWHILVPLIGMLGYINLSMLWSDVPSVTVKRAIVLSIIGFTGFCLGRIWDFKRFALAIVFLSTSFLAISVAAEIAFGTFLSLGEDYRFSGIFHPSRQAFNCGLLATASLALFLDTKKKIYLLLTLIGLFFVVLTKSRTGLGATVFACATLVWNGSSWKQRGVAIGIAMLVGFGILATAVAVNPKAVVEKLVLLGRDRDAADPTKLTGRLPIWSQALAEFSKRPIQGFGYGAFWTKKRLQQFERDNNWGLTHSHSAYIESLLNFGGVGFGLGFALLAAIYFHSWAVANRGYQAPTAKIVFAIMTLAMIASFTEIAFIADGYEAILFATCLGLACFGVEPLEQERQH
jgi:O-antigen ligase